MNEINIKVKKSSIYPQAKQFKINEGETSFGRKEGENDIILSEQGVSRKHALLSFNENNINIEDSGSGNGTFVNGRKIRELTKLKNGDVFQIGSTYFEIIIPPSEKELKKTSPQDHKKQEEKKKKNKKILIESAVFLFILMAIILLALKLTSSKTGKKGIPTPNECTSTYTILEQALRFNHPPKWTRLKKVRRHKFSYTYFNNTLLLFGTKYQGKDVIFAIDILDGIPSKTKLNQIIDSKRDKYPRLLAHGKPYIYQKNVNINGKEAILCESPPFKIAAELKSLEAFFLENNRRILIIAFTEVDIFEKFRPLFEHMINSFRIDPYTRSLNKPKNIRLEVTRLIKSGKALIERQNVQESNLYLAMKNFETASLLINIYDYREEDSLRSDLLKTFKQANKALIVKYKDLKFKIEKGRKIHQDEIVYQAVREILNLIPDPEDSRHQDALKSYNKLKRKYEMNNAYSKR